MSFTIHEIAPFAADLAIDKDTTIDGGSALSTLDESNIIVFESTVAAEANPLPILTIDVDTLTCSFYIFGHVTVRILAATTGEIGTRLGFGAGVSSVSFLNRASVGQSLVDPAFRTISGGEFLWSQVEVEDKIVAPTEKTANESRTHLLVAGTDGAILGACMSTLGSIFAAGVNLAGLEDIDLERTRFATVTTGSPEVSRCFIDMSSEDIQTTFTKRTTLSRTVELEVTRDTDDVKSHTIIVNPPGSGSSELTFEMVSNGLPQLVLQANSSVDVRGLLDPDKPQFSKFTIETVEDALVELSMVHILADTMTEGDEDQPEGLVVEGAGSVVLEDCFVLAPDPDDVDEFITSVLCRIADSSAVEFKSTGTFAGTYEGANDLFVARQLRLRISKNAEVSFRGAVLVSPGHGDDAIIVTESLPDSGLFALILENNEDHVADAHISVSFYGNDKPSYLVCETLSSNGILVDTKDGKTPISIRTMVQPDGGESDHAVTLKTFRTAVFDPDTAVLNNVGVLFRDSAHYVMDIDRVQLSNANGDTNSGDYGSLVFGTQAMSVDADSRPNLDNILQQQASGSLPVWISRERHVLTSWRAGESIALERKWNADKSLRVLKYWWDDEEAATPFRMRLDASFVVGLDDGRFFTGKDGGIDLHLEVLISDSQYTTEDPDAKAEILANVQQAVFGDDTNDIVPHTGVCGFFNNQELGKETVRVWDADPSASFSVFFETDNGIDITDPDGETRKKFIHTGMNVFAITFSEPEKDVKILADSPAHMIPRLTYTIFDYAINTEDLEDEEPIVDLFLNENNAENWTLVDRTVSMSISQSERKLRVSMRRFMFLWPSNLLLGRAVGAQYEGGPTDPHVDNNDLLDNLLVKQNNAYASLSIKNIISLIPHLVHDDIYVYSMSDTFFIRHSSNVSTTGWPNDDLATLSFHMTAIPNLTDNSLITRDQDTHVIPLSMNIPRVVLVLEAEVSLYLAVPNVLLLKGGTVDLEAVLPGDFKGELGNFANYTDVDLLAQHEAVEFDQASYTYADTSGSTTIATQEETMEQNVLRTKETFELALSMFARPKIDGELTARLNPNLLDAADLATYNAWLTTITGTHAESQLFLIVPNNKSDQQVISADNALQVSSFIEDDGTEETLWQVTVPTNTDGVSSQQVTVKWHATKSETYKDGKYTVLIVPKDVLGDATTTTEATPVLFNVRPMTTDGLCKMSYQTIGNVMRAEFDVVPLLRSAIGDSETSASTFAVYSRIPLLMHVRAHDYLGATKQTIQVTYKEDQFQNHRYTFGKADSTGLLEVQFLALPAVEADQNTPAFEFELTTMTSFETSEISQFSIKPKQIADGEGGFATNVDRLFVGQTEIAPGFTSVFQRTTAADPSTTYGGLDATDDDAPGRRTYRIRTIWEPQADPVVNRNFFMRIKSVNVLAYQGEAFAIEARTIDDTLSARKSYAFNDETLFSSAVLNWTSNNDDYGEDEIVSDTTSNVTYEFQSQISSSSRSGGSLQVLDTGFMRQSRISETLVEQQTGFSSGVRNPVITNPVSGAGLTRDLASIRERVWVGICPLGAIPANLELFFRVRVDGKDSSDATSSYYASVYVSHDDEDQVTSGQPVAMPQNDQQSWRGAWVDVSDVQTQLPSGYAPQTAFVAAMIRTKEGDTSIFPNAPGAVEIPLGQIDLREAGMTELSQIDDVVLSHVRIGNWMMGSDAAGDLYFRHRVWADEKEASDLLGGKMQALVDAQSVTAIQTEIGEQSPGAVAVTASEFRLIGHQNLHA